MTKRSWGNGNVYARGPDIWRLRYSVGGRRYTATFKGSKAEARAERRHWRAR
jgi:integrase